MWVAIVAAWRLMANRGPMGWWPSTYGSISMPMMNNSISVNGDGKVYAKPDMFTANIAITENATTTKEALTKTNNKVKQIMDIAVAEWVDKKDILTTNVSMYPRYNYINGRSEPDWYDSTQNLTIKIKNLDSASVILDKLSAVDGLQIQNTSYDIDNKEKVFEQARELAFKKAQSKAEQLAKLAGVSLGKVISISDMTVDMYPVGPYPMYKNAMTEGMGGVSSDNSSPMSPGEMTFEMNVNVVYSIR